MSACRDAASHTSHNNSVPWTFTRSASWRKALLRGAALNSHVQPGDQDRTRGGGRRGPSTASPLHAYEQACTRACAPVCMRVCTQECMDACMGVCAWVCAVCVWLCVYTGVCTVSVCTGVCVCICTYIYIHTYISVQLSCSVMSDSLRPHGLQDARPPCPSPTPGAYSKTCPFSQ